MDIKPITVMVIGDVDQTRSMPHKARAVFQKRLYLDPEGVTITLMASLVVLGCCAGVAFIVVGLLRL